MSGITKILTRTPGELGSIKTNKSPIIEENKQLPAEQWNTAADAIIEIQTAIGEAANPSPGSITGVLGDHEERISELEQNGGGGTPDRIESPSGNAFSEATDDFKGSGIPALVAGVNAHGGIGRVATSVLPGEDPSSHVVVSQLWAGEEGNDENGVGFSAYYDATTGAKGIGVEGAPLRVEEPTESSHAATKGYVDDRYIVEWWEPVWTPVSNVDSVSNVECQYTRTYRTAGGSLVTLEGTIEVTPDAANTMTMVSVDLPVPRDGVDMVAGIGSFTDYDGDDFGVARAGVADLGGGQQVALQYTPSTDAVHRVSFRISYRAA